MPENVPGGTGCLSRICWSVQSRPRAPILRRDIIMELYITDDIRIVRFDKLNYQLQYWLATQNKWIIHGFYHSVAGALRAIHKMPPHSMDTGVYDLESFAARMEEWEQTIGDSLDEAKITKYLKPIRKKRLKRKV